MAKIAALSGFPEWLPAERLVEQHVIDVFREVAELHGFSGIETRAVEPLDQLLRKGEIDKEVYVLRRLHAEEEGAEPSREDRSRTLGLHFDLTVPLARYVLEHQNDLAFPLRRFQIQKVWRGERPQDGRFREFYQADLDVIGQDTLPGHIEAEVAVVMAEILDRLPMPSFTIHANTRRLSEGFFRSIGLEDQSAVLRNLDKLPKIGPQAVHDLLLAETGASPEQARACLDFASIRTRDGSFARAGAGPRRQRRDGRAGDRRAHRGDRARRSRRTRRDPGRSVQSRRGSTTTPARSSRPSWPGTSPSARSAPAAATTLWPPTTATPTPVSVCRSACRGWSRACSRQGSPRPAARCPPACWSPSRMSRHRHLSDAAAKALRGRGIPCEVAPSAGQVRQADPLCGSPRDPLHLVPGGRRRRRPGQGHPQRWAVRCRRRESGSHRSRTAPCGCSQRTPSRPPHRAEEPGTWGRILQTG